MPVPVFSRSGIALSVLDLDGTVRYVLNRWQQFELESPGTYTLEGPNQSGKSVLIKLLMGVHTPKVESEKTSHPTILDQENVNISHVADANAHGLVAVFQDDDLIASMTVREQVLLRHATPTWRNYFSIAVRKFYGLAWLDRVRRHLGILDHLKALKPSEAAAYPATEVVEQAQALLELYGDQYGRILEKYPRELSGGAKAVARLVLAQLTKGIKVLFLDEAFSGVQADRWPRLVEVLKKWAVEAGVSIVAVSHNQRELIQWQPLKRFVIRDGELIGRGVAGYSSLQPGLPRRTDAFPIFEPPLRKPWFDPFQGPFLVLIDRNIEHHPAAETILEFLRQKTDKPVHLHVIDISEEKKNWAQFEDLLAGALAHFPAPEGAIVVVGGGTLLNLGFLVASVLHRGRMPCVLVPSTVMALADVVVGSKTGVNIAKGELGQERNLKHAVGVYENPIAVVSDKGFFSTLSSHERKIGLAETLKHGMVQDQELFRACVDALESIEPSIDKCYSLALRTLDLKREILTFDPWEEREGRLLLFGHLHAHSLERAWGYQISHGEAVFLGLLLDLDLAGPPELFDETLKVLARAGGLVRQKTLDLSPETLAEAYALDAYQRPAGENGDRRFDVLQLPKLAAYETPEEARLEFRSVRLTEILTAVSSLREKLPA